MKLYMHKKLKPCFSRALFGFLGHNFSFFFLGTIFGFSAVNFWKSSRGKIVFLGQFLVVFSFFLGQFYFFLGQKKTLLDTIREFEENRRTIFTTTHLPNHPSIRTIKVFGISKKVDLRVFETPTFVHQWHINWKDSQVDPIGRVRSHLPSGDKALQSGNIRCI